MVTNADLNMLSDAVFFTGAGLAPRESEVTFWQMEGNTNMEIGMLTKLQTARALVTLLFHKAGTGIRLALTPHCSQWGNIERKLSDELRQWTMERNLQ